MRVSMLRECAPEADTMVMLRTGRDARGGATYGSEALELYWMRTL
jgi:hypothetical protein